jgi:PAS domain S-box-containing protein
VGSTERVPSDHDIIHAIADDLPVGIWVARAPDGEFVYANHTFAEIMGQAGRDDAKVGSYSAPYGICTRDGKPYPEERMPFVRALRERRVVVVDDLTIHRPDGTLVHVRAFARPISDDNGIITHVVIAFFDVTREVDAEFAKAESERRLQRGQRLEAIGTLAGGIAHDFNNLIFGVKLLAAELGVHETDPQRRASLALIDDITERCAMLTRSLLGFARRGKHRAAPVAVDDLIDGMSELLRRTLSGVTITFETGAAQRGTVIADRAQLEQVLMNLAVNAAEAIADTGRGGRIAVRTRTDDDAVVLEVADDGPGIPPELRDRVFEPYFTTKTPERGTGLGLATVFGIVENHGGTIEIAPGLEGRGTTMRMRLPAVRAAAAPPPRAPTRDVPAGSGTVLVVDDDALVRRSVVGALRSLGYDTVEAEGGAEAIHVYRHRRDLRAVVLDMVMPDMNGRATLAAMRAVDPGIPVLLMSGYTINEEIQLVPRRGCLGLPQQAVLGRGARALARRRDPELARRSPRTRTAAAARMASPRRTRSEPSATRLGVRTDLPRRRHDPSQHRCIDDELDRRDRAFGLRRRPRVDPAAVAAEPRCVERELAKRARRRRRQRDAGVVLELDDDAMRLSALQRIPRRDDARLRLVARHRRVDARAAQAPEGDGRERRRGDPRRDRDGRMCEIHAPRHFKRRATRNPA